jgi:hypothetical protein
LLPARPVTWRATVVLPRERTLHPSGVSRMRGHLRQGDGARVLGTGVRLVVALHSVRSRLADLEELVPPFNLKTKQQAQCSVRADLAIFITPATAAARSRLRVRAPPSAYIGAAAHRGSVGHISRRQAYALIPLWPLCKTEQFPTLLFPPKCPYVQPSARSITLLTTPQPFNNRCAKPVEKIAPSGSERQACAQIHRFALFPCNPSGSQFS